MSHAQQSLFLITGVSSGFGRALAEAALRAGHRVAGTLRDAGALAAFEALAPGRAIGVRLDVTDAGAVAREVARLEAEHGAIEVLVNNAGYGHEGILEESPLEALRRQFEVNVFGAVAVLKAVLPGMRRRRSGRILNVTSMGGFITLPGIAYYCGSKFALEGISATLASEVEGFGIQVTAVAPGSFRTDWAGRSMDRSARSEADYDALFEPIRAAREAKSGRQLGDPARAAQAMLRLLRMPKQPRHLLLGSDAVQLVRAQLRALEEEIALHEALSLSTDAPL
ncbi:oxidoreductase [Pseudomonas citronellolis]|uniref:oxidoreductase n=1 Tax=Pseudomonas citronellolis TaxID=53408 RepID=UPI0023E4589E|nr:oxidoreductase [Pseudomonas citronellolis]MDF3932549.1 oxidoreductase [Pseudomonas citronellolis]